VNIDDPRKGVDVYAKRACQILLTLRSFVEYGQVKGLYGANDVIVKQGCNRRWEVKGAKREVENKRDVYQRNSSCDQLDAAAIGIDMLVQKGFIAGGQSGGSSSTFERRTGVQAGREEAALDLRQRNRDAGELKWDAQPGQFDPRRVRRRGDTAAAPVGDGGFDEGNLDY